MGSATVYRLTFRFKHIVLLFDMDKTGRESSRKQEKLLEEFGVKRLLLPLPGTKEEKDISDYFKAALCLPLAVICMPSVSTSAPAGQMQPATIAAT